MSKRVYIPIILALLVALFAGLVANTDALAQEREPGKRLRAIRNGLGQVTAIGADNFTIEKLNGDEVSFLVEENTRIIDREKNELSFADMQIGQWVIAAGPENEQGERVARLVVILPEDFDPSEFAGAVGRITSVDLNAQQFSLETREGELMTFSVDENTRFWGGAQDLASLEEGMGAGVRAKKQADGSLLALVVRTRLSLQKYAGEITAVDLAAGTFDLHTRRGDQDLTFKVDENTRFRSKDGQVESLEDLEVGMVAVVVARKAVQADPLVAAWVAAASRQDLPSFDKKVGGRVMSVDKNTFTIKARDGQEYSFQVTGSTKFRSRAGQVTGLEDLQEGMAVIVGAKELGNGRLQAELVIVLPRLKGGSATGF